MKQNPLEQENARLQLELDRKNKAYKDLFKAYRELLTEMEKMKSFIKLYTIAKEKKS